MRVFSVMLVMACLLCGCAVKKKAPPAPEPEIPAETALSKAADEIQRDLRMLIGDREADLNPSAVAALTASSSYRFTGELEDLAKDVAKRIGYKADFTGKVPSQAIIVTIYSIEPLSWFHILQSAGTQAGDRADLIVNARTKTITVAYGGINSPKFSKTSKGERASKSKKNLLVYRGDISGAHKKIAQKLGYRARTVGTPKRGSVNISSGNRSWNEIIDLINMKNGVALITVDDASETVILTYK